MSTALGDYRPDQPERKSYPVLSTAPSNGDLESVVVSTAELGRRTARPPDHAAENRALVSLARVMATSPDCILQKLADTALTLCRAQSAGISLLDESGKSFHWPAVAGQWARHLGGGTPRDFGPCGTVLERNTALVFSHPERHFTYLAEVKPYLEEGLLVPCYVEGAAVGTIWVVVHDQSHRFDAEDLRVLTSLAEFEGAAYQTLRSLQRVSQAAAALGESEGRMRELFAVLPAAIYMTDAKGLITYYNDAAAELWGCRPELGKSEFCGSWKLYWPDGRPMAHDECPMAVALRTGEPVRGAEAIAERPDGTRVPFVPFPTPRRDAAGQLVGAINMLVDISEHKRAQQDAQRLAAIVESSDDAIVSKDLNGIITSWNAGAQRMFGYTAEELVGKSVTTLIPAGRHDEEPGILDRIKRGERVEHYETVRLRKDGSLIEVSLTVSPIRDATGKVIGASKIARDITERKEAQTRRDMLTQEIHHRTKNLFAVVQAVVSRSFADKATVKEAEVAVLSRLQSLAQTHVLLVDKDWQGADLGDVVRSEMAPYAGRITVEGPRIALGPQAAQNFALALHELATNAVKYGALSHPRGRIHIGWRVFKPNGHQQLTFNWQETGGPPVFAPNRRGFGSTVLEQVMAQYFDTAPAIEFAEDGVRYELSGSLDALAG